MSLLVWKIDPRRTSASRSSAALTRLPLWQMAMGPCTQSIRIGCALASLLSPAVEDPDVPDGHRPGEPGEFCLSEDVGDVAHGPRRDEAGAVGGGDAGALLAAVLQGVEAEVGHPRRLRVAPDAEHAARLSELANIAFPGASAPVRRRPLALR